MLLNNTLGSQLIKRTDSIVLKFQGSQYKRKNDFKFDSNREETSDETVKTLTKTTKSLKKIRKVDLQFD